MSNRIATRAAYAASCLLAIVAAAGCVSTPATATTASLIRGGDDFATRGRARIEVQGGGTVSVSAEQTVVLSVPGNQHEHLWGLVRTGTPDRNEEVAIATFVAGCSVDHHNPGCLADRALGQDFLVGTRHRPSGSLIAMGVFGAVATVVSVACLAVCNTDHPNAAYVGAGLGLITAIYPLSTIP